ncbi:MAG: hypothetical protein AAGU74_07345 [Bacillota bacterium]
MSKLKTLSVTSLFPAAPDVIWRRLIRIETLQYVASPLLMFEPASHEDAVWRAGETAQFLLRLLDILPLGLHTLRLETVDHATYTVQTRESSRLLPVWNHRITIEPMGSGSSFYTDTVQIGAGRRTSFIHLFARVFFRHRHRRWLKLLKGATPGSAGTA